MKKYFNAKNIILILILLISLFGFIYSLVNVIKWKNDNDNLLDEVDQINEVVEVNEIEDSENTELVPQEEEIPKFNPYWDYIKMNLIDVDFTDLKNTNSETVGWLQVLGTNINYPFVQGSDNDYYLNHSINKKKNQAGWAFMDYRNNPNDYDKNTIIYGHSLKSGAIFGSLINILSSNWKKNTDNHVVKISTETENTLWQVFSIYTIPDTIDYLTIDFDSDTEYSDFLNMISSRSVYNFNTSVSTNDKIITLSSCYRTGDKKLVLHAKLIKRESR